MVGFSYASRGKWFGDEVPNKTDQIAIQKPFCPGWLAAWKVAAKWFYVADEFQKFLDLQGVDILTRLTTKGANPNFVLCLLVTNFWNENVPTSDESSSRIRSTTPEGNKYGQGFTLVLDDRRPNETTIGRRISW
jgi:hypothetical protein